MIDPKIINAKVLIVDDTQSNIDILTGLLDAKGYVNYQSVIDSRNVLSVFREYKPDIILLDLNMPHLTGFQVMEQLREVIPEKTYFPILVLTADFTPESKRKALSDGATDFLTKPFDLVEVDLRIKNLLQTRFLHQKLETQNLHLDELVRERTKELERTNIDLIHAKEKAEEMNKLKSIFLSNISHEMRTPLISILGFSEILESEIEIPDQKESVQHIWDAGKRLQNTIEGILSIQQLENKRIEVSNHRFELNKMIKHISEKFNSVAKKKEIHFQVNLSEKEVWLNSDPELLREVVINVLDNSFKFTKEGEILISVSVTNDEKNCYSVIKIKDTGSGIESNKTEMVFMDFRQGSEGLSRSHEGMGVGLTIAKQYTELMQGEIAIESELGKGTVVSIKVPALQLEEEITSQVEERKTEIIDESELTESTEPKILIVEDNEANRKLFALYLRNDFLVEDAEDGVSAIAKAETSQYDLIFMDINLGAGIDGIETFRRIRSLVDCENIPIIALTAFAMKEDRKKFLDLGFTDYQRKPVTRAELIQLAKKHCLQGKEKLSN